MGTDSDAIEKPVLALTMPGDPTSKGRPRIGKRGHAYTPDKTRTAERVAALLVRQALAGRRPAGFATGCFAVTLEFFTKGWQRRDLDNLTKLVLDSCTGLIWDDDSQVTELHCRMTWADPEPRTVLTITDADPQAKPALPCEMCGVPVRQYPSAPKRFCSAPCGYAFRRRRDEVPCVGCGTPVAIKPSKVGVQKPWCSLLCRATHTSIALVCVTCGTEYTRNKKGYKTGARAFCTDECRRAFWRNQKKTASEGTCADCGGSTTKKAYKRCQACAIDRRARTVEECL